MKKVFKMKTECPYCNYKLDAHFNSKDADDKERPHDNDLGFCINCGEVLEFIKNKAEKIDIDTLDEVSKQEIIRVTDAWRKMKSLESIK